MDYRINTDSSKVSDKISEAYSNLESMRVAINNLKITSCDVALKSSRILGDSLNNSKVLIKDNDLSEKPSKPLKRDNSQLVTSRSNIYINNQSLNHNIPDNSNSLNYQNSSFKKSYNNINSNTRSHKSINHNVVNHYPSQSVVNNGNYTNEKNNYMNNNKDLNVSTSTINNFKTIEYLEREFDFLKDEYEGTLVTNRILNKSNLDLKSQIRLLECELNNKENDKLKISEQSKIIEELRDSNANLQKLHQESNDMIQSLKQLNNELNHENLDIKTSYEDFKNAYNQIENDKEDLKKNIENSQENTKCKQDEIFQLNQQILEKDRFISEQTEKIMSSSSLNENLKKSLKDYEDMLFGVKKTLEIIKKSNCNNDVSIQNLNKTVIEQQEIIEFKNQAVNEMESKNIELSNEIDFIKQEILSLKEVLNSKENTILENYNVIRNLNSEIEKGKIKIESFSKIVEDKENTIINIKNSVTMLNRNLEETNETIEKYKKMNNDGMSCKSLLIKSSEKYEVENSDLKKKYDDLLSLKEILVYKISSLESDLNDLRLKEGRIYDERETLALQNQLINDRLKEVLKENTKLFEEKNNNEKTISQLEGKINEINNIYNQMYRNDMILKNEVETLNSKLNFKDKTLETFIKSKEELNEELLILKERFSLLSFENSKKNNGNDDKINEFKLNEIKLKKELDKFKSELNSKDIHIDTLNNLVSDLKNKMNAITKKKDEEIIIYERTVDDLKKQINLLTDVVNKLRIELDDSRNDLRYKAKMIDSFNTDIKEFNESLANSKRENEKLKLLLMEKTDLLEEQKKLMLKNEKDDKKHHDKIKNQDDFNFNFQEIINKCNNYQKDYYDMKNAYDKIAFIYKNLLEKYSLLDKNRSGNNNNEIQPDVCSNLSIESNIDNININEFEFNNLRLKSEESKENPNNLLIHKTESEEKAAMSTSQLNLKITQKYNSEKITISQGNVILLSIYDSKRLLKFDIEERTFKFIEFADFGDYEENFQLEGSFCLTCDNSFFIITGHNHDLLYLYNDKKHSMSKLKKLNFNHTSGSLVLHNNSLYCLSGLYNKKVEKYINNELLSMKSNDFAFKKFNDSWQELYEMIFERSSCSYIAIDNKYLYAIYGFNGPSNKCLDSIERMNMERQSIWELFNIRGSRNISISLYGHCSIKKDEDIILFGGINGINNLPNKNVFLINLQSNSIIETNKKCDADKNPMMFLRNNNSVYYQEKNSKKNFNVIFDHDLTVHNIYLDNLDFTKYKPN